jgi:DNA repair protein RecN (Recombination protein N)
MLKSINIKDFAIISGLSLDFAPGLNIFTGETGAGKSIVIEALGFTLGARGDAGLIRPGADKMEVAAVFESVPLPDNLKQKYKITGPDFTVRRELDQKSKSKAWVNGLSVLVSDLDAIGSVLVDFHGQHEHQVLFKPAAHLDILDVYAGAQKELAAVRAAHGEAQDIKAKLEALKMSEGERARLLELYKYQLEEIEKLSPKPGEDAEIETALPKLKNAARLQQSAAAAYDILSAREGAACELLAKAEHLLNDMAQFDSNLAVSSRELASARAGVEDIASALSSYKDGIDADPKALDAILARQEALRKLKLKYGPALEDVLSKAQSLKKQIEDLQGGGYSAQKLEAALDKALKKLLSLSEALSARRGAAAKKLGAAVAAEIAPLGFEQVRFETALETPCEPGPKGMDSVEFLFSPNPGLALRPLRNIASGGEISRLMLGLKTVLNGGTPIMVFDEIDAGISGHTGKLVGAKLKKVSAGRQVLCVTHLPQVAVYADLHFSVAKAVKNKTTEINVKTLEDANKVREIARMIGSSKEASAGYKHAQDLLAEAGGKF